MSPLKRKAARPARSGAKARKAGGKARGTKARGVALAAGSSARGKARRAAAGLRGECDMPVERLAAAFDRDDGAAELLAHVPGCGACTTSLTVLAATGKGVKALTAEASGGTAVERVLARGAEAGTRKLADLVYELAKACLVVVQDVDRRLHMEQRPREQAVIDREVRGVAARLPAHEQQAADGLPRVKPSEERAIEAAGSCIRILEQVEGKSERQRLSRAVWLICSGRPGEAEGELERVLASAQRPDVRLHAFRNLQWALNRQRSYPKSVDIGVSAHAAFPSDWQIAYNLAVASAGAGNQKLFRRTALHLTSIPAPSPESTKFRRNVLSFEAQRFAEKLHVPLAEVERAFGVRALSAGGDL